MVEALEALDPGPGGSAAASVLELPCPLAPAPAAVSLILMIQSVSHLEANLAMVAHGASYLSGGASAASAPAQRH